MSLRDQILSATDTPLSEPIEVPEWNGVTVHICTMTGDEREAWEDVAFQDGKETETTRFRATLLAACLVDGSRTRIFSFDDVLPLSAKSGAVLARLYPIAAKANGLAKAEVDKLTKN